MRTQRPSVLRPPTLEELARRQKLVAEILANRKGRVISPYTTADLVHAAREGRELEWPPREGGEQL